jgi:hypothetical protein
MRKGKSTAWVAQGAGKGATPAAGVRSRKDEGQVCSHVNGLSPALTQRLKVFPYRTAERGRQVKLNAQ